MKSNIAWGIFLVVPVVVILSISLPQVVSAFLIPVGFIAAVVAVVVDASLKKLKRKEQVFKAFCYSLLFIRIGQVLNWDILVGIATVIACLLTLALVCLFSYTLDDMAEQARKIDEK